MSDEYGRRAVYGLISSFLSAKDRGTLMRVEKAAYDVVGNAPFPGSDVSVRDVSTQLSGFKQIGLHGTSTVDESSLYEGVQPVEEGSRTFKKSGELGGQLGPGFYITEGFGTGEKNAAKQYAQDRKDKVGGEKTLMRAHVFNFPNLKIMESLGGKGDLWWPKVGENPEYLKPHTIKEHKFFHNKENVFKTITKESGTDAVTSFIGGVGVTRNPIKEYYSGVLARQLKLNWHAFVDTPLRKGAKVMMTPHETDKPLPKSFLDAVSKRKNSSNF